MAIPESLLTFAGFIFAHATWSVSDLPKDDLLVPIVAYQIEGKIHLDRIEANTQEESITKAKLYLKENESRFESWVFVREGKILLAGKYTDTLTVEAKEKGKSETVVFVQKFQPFSTGHFKLLAAPMVFINGKEIIGTEAKQYTEKLLLGVQNHQKASVLWPSWQ